MAFPDAWTEKALVEIQAKGQDETIQFHAITDDITINEGDRPGEDIASLAGGRIWTDKPQEDGEVTLTMYPVELDTTDTTGVGGLFQQYSGYLTTAGDYDETATGVGLQTAGAVGSGLLDSTRRYSKDEFRICITWTNDPALTTASGTNASATDALRFVARSCRIVSHSVTFNPGEPLKVEITLKFPPFTKAGANNYLWQSAGAADSNARLPALATYT